MAARPDARSIARCFSGFSRATVSEKLRKKARSPPDFFSGGLLAFGHRRADRVDGSLNRRSDLSQALGGDAFASFLPLSYGVNRPRPMREESRPSTRETRASMKAYCPTATGDGRLIVCGEVGGVTESPKILSAYLKGPA